MRHSLFKLLVMFSLILRRMGVCLYRQHEATVVPPKPAFSSIKTETGEEWKVSNRKVSTRDPLPISCRCPCKWEQGNDGPEGMEGHGKYSWGQTGLVSCG